MTPGDPPVDFDAAKATIGKANRFAKKAFDAGEAENLSQFVHGLDVFEAKNFARHFYLSLDVVGGVVKVVEVGGEVLVVNVSEQTIAIESCGGFEEGCCLEHVCSEVV